MKFTTVNLLPNEYVNQFGAERWRRLTVFYGKILIVLLALFAAELLAIAAAARIEEVSLLPDATLMRQIEEFRELEKEARALNRTLTLAHTALLKGEPAHAFIETVVALVPEAISLTKLEFARAEKRLTLTGKAESRAALLALEAALKERPNVENAVIPLTSLAKAQNLDFTLAVTFRF